MLPAILLSLALLASQATATSPPSEAAAAPSTPAKPCGVDASGKYHIGCGVSTPRVVYQVDPEFPKEAQKKKISGAVLVGLTVDAQGNPTDIHILRSAAETADKKHRAAATSLDAKALEAVKLYRVEPATYEGKPVPVELNVEINFQIF